MRRCALRQPFCLTKQPLTAKNINTPPPQATRSNQTLKTLKTLAPVPLPTHPEAWRWIMEMIAS